MTNHRARFKASPALIADVLCMPSDCEIYGVQWDFVSNTVEFFVEGACLPEVRDGELIPISYPTLESSRDEHSRAIIKWDWNLKGK